MLLKQSAHANVVQTSEPHTDVHRTDMHRTDCMTLHQVVANELITTVYHPWAAYAMRQPRPPARFSEAPYTLRHHAPLLGQHNTEILREVGADVAELTAQGVVLEKRGRKPEKKAVDGRSYDPSSG